MRTKALKRIDGCSRYAKDRPSGLLGLRNTGVRKEKVRLRGRRVWMINERGDERFRLRKTDVSRKRTSRQLDSPCYFLILFYCPKLRRMVEVVSNS